jgi:rhodanese-related sulfurtransferase
VTALNFWELLRRPAGLKDLSPDALSQLLAANGAVRVVDVRTRREYARGHVAGALSAPLGETGPAIREWPRETPVVLICQSGHRSQAAAHELLRMGFSNVSHLRGGMFAWMRRSLPQSSDGR